MQFSQYTLKKDFEDFSAVIQFIHLLLPSRRRFSFSCQSLISYETNKQLFVVHSIDGFTSKNLAVSYVSGLSASLLVLPLWTIRTRVSLLTLEKEKGSQAVKSTVSANWLLLKESIFKDKFKGLYRGAISNVFLSATPMIQYTCYDWLKAELVCIFKKQSGSIQSLLARYSGRFKQTNCERHSLSFHPYQIKTAIDK